MSQKHPLGVEKLTTLVPFIGESNPQGLYTLQFEIIAEIEIVTADFKLKNRKVMVKRGSRIDYDNAYKEESQTDNM